MQMHSFVILFPLNQIKFEPQIWYIYRTYKHLPVCVKFKKCLPTSRSVKMVAPFAMLQQRSGSCKRMQIMVNICHLAPGSAAKLLYHHAR